MKNHIKNLNKETLKKENTDLKNENNNLKKEFDYKNQNINNYKNELNNLKSSLNFKENTILNLNNHINNLNNKINNFILNSGIKDVKVNINDILVISFKSLDQRIDISFPCQKSNIFVWIEEKLYNEYPNYKDLNTYFTVNGIFIKRLEV